MSVCLAVRLSMANLWMFRGDCIRVGNAKVQAETELCLEHFCRNNKTKGSNCKTASWRLYFLWEVLVRSSKNFTLVWLMFHTISHTICISTLSDVFIGDDWSVSRLYETFRFAFFSESILPRSSKLCIMINSIETYTLGYQFQWPWSNCRGTSVSDSQRWNWKLCFCLNRFFFSWGQTWYE